MANRKNFPSWLSILLLAGLGISIGPPPSLTRTSEVSRVLSPVLSNYELIRMEPGEIERQVRTTGELRFRFGETDFYFNLEPHDMRAPNYRAVETGPGGVRQTLPPQPVHTFKGVLAGREDTRGRFNLTDGGVEGVVYAPEGWVYVEPLRNYLPDAPSGELVVYGHADIRPGEDLKCGVSLAGRLERGVNRITAQVTFGAPTNYVAEVATEADYEYVQALGGSTEAIREILGILNQVEGVYQSELLLQLRISFQHAWGTEEDPYTARNASDLLAEFANHWNTHYAEKEDYDLAHLWTDRERDDRFIAGLASQSVACNRRSASYGLSTRQTDSPDKYVTPAHEIGHNFGATHPDQVDPPVSLCINTAMGGTIFGGGNKQLTFCQFSRDQIAEHVSRNNSCLVAQDISLQPPTDLSATVTSDFGIRLNWHDNSTNETGFILQARNEASGSWFEVGTTAADAETFSSGNLFPGTTYVFRVQAFNDMQSSGFSNHAAAATPEGRPPVPEWRIDTIAGGTNNDGESGPALTARLADPTGLAVDRSGNVYIADPERNTVRRVDSRGTISTVAGTGERGYGGDGGLAVDAQLSGPIGVAVDADGNIYFSDIGNDRIRRVSAKGIITTFAGTGEEGYSGDGGPAVEAQLSAPRGLAVDSSGNLYIADTRNHAIRRVDTTGTITTVAGSGERGNGGDGGAAVEARLNTPRDIAVDGSGNLYIADTRTSTVRQVDTAGIITTIAGTGEQGYSGDGGSAVSAQLSAPYRVSVDGSGNLFIADTWNHRVRKVDTRGIITTIAGIGGIGINNDGGYSGDGGPAVEAQLDSPRGIAVGGSGNLYIADTGNDRIRRVDTAGIITTIAGVGETSYSGDGGHAVSALLNYPAGVAVDDSGILYIADTGNHRIRRVDTAGIITTIAGTGEAGYGGDGGPAVEALLNSPRGIAVDGAGNLLIADYENGRIRRVDSTGIMTTVAGAGSSGGSAGDGQQALETQLSRAHDVAVDGSGNLYIAETGDRRIRRMDVNGVITTVAGIGFVRAYVLGLDDYSGDGGPAVEANLWGPHGVAVDNSGNVFIADTHNRRIRRVDSSGIITTLAGIGDGWFNRNSGPADLAALSRPRDVSVDGAGNVYIADSAYNSIRRVDSSGIITTIAGQERPGFYGDGGPAVEAHLNDPQAVAVDSSGNLYIADTRNHRIRVLTRLPRPPGGLTATAVSFTEIKLAWQDNTSDEAGFLVQRRVDGSSKWIEIGTTAANATTFSDEGLEPLTTYHYRVRAFNNAESSYFSNEASATTLEVLPPTLTRFAPTRGPVGMRITITGAHFHGARAVEFNGVPAARFEVVSGRNIEAVVPAEATSGPISVVTPGGTAVSADHFTVIDSGIASRLFVPIVLRAQGRTPGSFFTSELTLTNRGTTTATIRYTYRAAFGGGSGTAVDSLEPGRQRIVPDAIAFLTSLGVPIGSGSAGGTLAVDFSNLSSPSDAGGTVRVTTPVEEGNGRAGLAYLGLNPDRLLTGPVFISGLRQNRQDRSNVAVQNAGEEATTLRVTVYSGDPEEPGSLVLPDLSLPAGGFHQYNRILNEAGFDNGYARVEQVEGTAPYYAYGVINDNFNSDGSFVFPVREDSLAGRRGQTLPVIIDTKDFASELTVTNFLSAPKTVDFRFVGEAVETDDDTAGFSLELEAGEQRIIPGIVDWLRQEEVAGIGASDKAFVGAVFATVAEGDMSGIVLGARTGSPDGRGGQYGLFYNGIPYGSASTESAWIFGLQQNDENRSNLALVNTGEVDDREITLEIDTYDGEGNSEPRTRSVVLGPWRWHQLNGILAGTSQGYVEVRRIRGDNPFIAYGVVNDGARRGQRSGDGAFLPSQ